MEGYLVLPCKIKVYDFSIAAHFWLVWSSLHSLCIKKKTKKPQRL